MAELRAGVVGLGVMGQHHARVLNTLPGVQLVGIVDPQIARKSLNGPAPMFDSLDELLKAGVDYCFVAVPTDAHLGIGLELAGAGVHALIEKPLAGDSQQAHALKEAFSAAGLVGAVGHVERYNSALQQARQRLANGELGQIFQVSTNRQGPFPARISDVGVVKDLATHDIDLTAWVTQRSYQSVAAKVAYKAGRDHEDLVTIVGELDDEIVAAHIVNWLSPFKQRQIVISGERGAFVADTLSSDLTFHTNGMVTNTWDELARFRGVTEGDVIRFAFPKKEPLRAEHEAFRDALLGRPSDLVTMEHGLATVEVADAVLESARSGQTVVLEGNRV